MPEAVRKPLRKRTVLPGHAAERAFLASILPESYDEPGQVARACNCA